MARTTEGSSPSSLRVVLAHDALQLGKLADHERHEVRLGEERGAVGVGLALGARAATFPSGSCPRGGAARSTRSSCVPSLLWYIIEASWGTRSGFAFLSVSRRRSARRRAAGARRARCPGRCWKDRRGAMLETIRNFDQELSLSAQRAGSISGSCCIGEDEALLRHREELRPRSAPTRTPRAIPRARSPRRGASHVGREGRRDARGGFSRQQPGDRPACARRSRR